MTILKNMGKVFFSNITALRGKATTMKRCVLLFYLTLLILNPVSAQGENRAVTTTQDAQLKTRVLLVPQRQTILSSLITGQVKRIMVNDGDRFRKGQTLVTMNCIIQKTHLNKAKAGHDAAKYAYHVQQQLEKRGSGSQLETKLATANLDKAKAQLQEMRATLSMCIIKAPFQGRVVERKIQPYQSVEKGTPLLEILDDTSLVAQLVVPSRWLKWLRKGLAFSIQLDETEQSYPAAVSQLGAQINPGSQTLHIWGKLKEKQPTSTLISGMSGVARFQPPRP